MKKENDNGRWFRGGKEVPSPLQGKRLTRRELQQALQHRISQGDMKAVEEWQRWKHVDQQLDQLRDKPLYPKDNNEKM